MKNAKVIAAVLLTAVLMSTTASAAAFKDVSKSAKYAQAVDYVSSAGLMVGYGDGTFKPEKTVTRAEMATVLCKILGKDKNLKKDGSKFFDVPESHWSNGYVVAAAELGVVSGYGQKRFGPDETVTYEQALTMLVNALKLGDYAGKMGGYPDGYIAVADGYGLLEGVNGQKGKQQTRAEIATMLMNYSNAREGKGLGIMGRGHYRSDSDDRCVLCIGQPVGKNVEVTLSVDPIGYDGWGWNAIVAGNGIFLGVGDDSGDPIGYIAFRPQNEVEVVILGVNYGPLYGINNVKMKYSSEKFKSYWEN